MKEEQQPKTLADRLQAYAKNPTSAAAGALRDALAQAGQVVSAAEVKAIEVQENGRVKAALSVGYLVCWPESGDVVQVG